MTHDQPFDADQLVREIDAEIKYLLHLGYDTPGICEESIEITDRCRDRLRAGKGCADFDWTAFVASVEAAVAGFEGTEDARDQMVYALMAARVPDDHEHYDFMECELVHRGWLADREGYLD